MAQYKVPQNVESEDKLLGPLTMKQFIYAVIGLAWGGLWYMILRAGGAAGLVLAIFVILPVSGFMFLLAFGRREEQSFENYLIALIRFTVVPRKRVWMKDTSVEHAIVDAPPPPKVQELTAADYAQVQSRLRQLAMVVDTRGHLKNEEVQALDPTNQAATFSQRVFTPPSLQQEIAPSQLQKGDDIISQTESGQKIQDVGRMLQNVEHDVRDQARQAMTQAIQDPSAVQTPAQPSQPQLSDDILKKVMDTTDLSVAQVAQAANRGQLQAGQPVSFR
ncbi:PrgI family protein [bacterium]|nr:PrgI family protein [bacterium]